MCLHCTVAWLLKVIKFNWAEIPNFCIILMWGVRADVITEPCPCCFSAWGMFVYFPPSSQHPVQSAQHSGSGAECSVTVTWITLTAIIAGDLTEWSKHLILGFGTTSVWFYKCVLWCQMYMAITGTLDILKWSWFCFWQFLSAYVGLGAEYFMIISGTSGLRGLHMETCPCNQIYSWHNYQNSLFTHPS